MTTGKRPLTDKDGDVRELKDSDLKRARKSAEVFPRSLQSKLGMPLEHQTEAHAELRAKYEEAHGDMLERMADAEDGFRRIGEKAARKYEAGVKSARDLFVPAFAVDRGLVKNCARLELASPDYGVKIDAQLYEAMVRDVLGKFPVKSLAKEEDRLVLLAVSKESRRGKSRRLEHMSRSEVEALVHVQSEVLERLKALFIAASVGAFEKGGSKLSCLSRELEKLEFAKRLREIAEEVEAPNSHAASRG